MRILNFHFKPLFCTPCETPLTTPQCSPGIVPLIWFFSSSLLCTGGTVSVTNLLTHFPADFVLLLLVPLCECVGITLSFVAWDKTWELHSRELGRGILKGWCIDTKKCKTGEEHVDQKVPLKTEEIICSQLYSTSDKDLRLKCCLDVLGAVRETFVYYSVFVLYTEILGCRCAKRFAQLFLKHWFTCWIRPF